MGEQLNGTTRRRELALDRRARRSCGSGPRAKAIAIQHVQAITVAIDQYAEKALGNRDYFLNKPYGVG